MKAFREEEGQGQVSGWEELLEMMLGHDHMWEDSDRAVVSGQARLITEHPSSGLADCSRLVENSHQL